MRGGPSRPHGVRVLAEGWEGRGAPALRAAAVLVLAGAVSATAGAQQRTSTPPALVFDGVTVVDVEQGKLVPNQRVVITGTRIQAVGGSGAVKLPEGARVVDARGKYLIPGLWDMHAHLDAQAGSQYPEFVASGVTGLREMAQRFWDGSDSFRTWQREIVAGTLVGPRGIGPSADLTNGHEGGGPGIEIETPDDAARIMDSLKADHIAFVKYHNSSGDRDLYFSMLREARRVGLPFVGHVPATVPGAEASDSGVRSIEHFNEVRPCWLDADTGWNTAAMEARCTPMVQAFLRNGTWMTPTLIAISILPDYLPAGNRVVRTMRQLGFKRFLAGSDYLINNGWEPGLSLLRELGLLVEAGLTPLEALQAATLHPAQFLEATDSLGTVAAGKLADLVLLDADPLADIHNVLRTSAVVANGRYFDRPALDSLAPEITTATKEYLDTLTRDGRHPRPVELGFRATDGEFTVDSAGTSMTHSGLEVKGWTRISSAKAAGLKLGDFIVRVDGMPVKSVSELLERFVAWHPGQIVRLGVRRPKDTVFDSSDKPAVMDTVLDVNVSLETVP